MRSVFESTVAPDQSIWRYMRTHRFTELLEQRCLHFASANQFEDPFEGAVAVQATDFPVDPRYAEMDQFERAFLPLKRLTKLSCWHVEKHESAAMWKLYSDEGKGVAITSTPESLSQSLAPFRLKPEYGIEDLWGGAVRYVDLLQERLRVSMLERFFYKHNAFSWEKEFRLAISLRLAEENGVTVPEAGILVQADVGSLIHEVYLGPALSDDEREQIMRAAELHGLGRRVKITSLLARPRYV